MREVKKMTVEKAQSLRNEMMDLGKQLGKVTRIDDIEGYIDWLNRYYKIISALIDEEIKVGTGV